MTEQRAMTSLQKRAMRRPAAYPIARKHRFALQRGVSSLVMTVLLQNDDVGPLPA
jgi:hypothetical protein